MELIAAPTRPTNRSTLKFTHDEVIRALKEYSKSKGYKFNVKSRFYVCTSNPNDVTKGLTLSADIDELNPAISLDKTAIS